jgi:hypothetical protein
VAAPWRLSTAGSRGAGTAGGPREPIGPIVGPVAGPAAAGCREVDSSSAPVTVLDHLACGGRWAGLGVLLVFRGYSDLGNMIVAGAALFVAAYTLQVSIPGPGGALGRASIRVRH